MIAIHAGGFGRGMGVPLVFLYTLSVAMTFPKSCLKASLMTIPVGTRAVVL